MMEKKKKWAKKVRKYLQVFHPSPKYISSLQGSMFNL